MRRTRKPDIPSDEIKLPAPLPPAALPWVAGDVSESALIVHKHPDGVEYWHDLAPPLKLSLLVIGEPSFAGRSA
jgi:hypothetical protein